MFSTQHDLQSVADVWLIWPLAGAALVLMTKHLVLRVRQFCPLQLLRGEEGASYTLSILMVLPVYVVLVGLFVECTLILQAKIGTTYAAYAAARSAAVWLPAETPIDHRIEKVRLAAVQAIAPFASARDLHLLGAGALQTNTTGEDEAYFEAYQQYSGGSAAKEYVIDKRRYANQATKVRVEQPETPRDRMMTIAVEYEMPINIPVIGRILGHAPSWPGARFYSRKIVSQVELEKESPKSKSHCLGIRYDTDH